jgi:tetratricopeptide (TPR) repeat protein
MKKLLLVLLFIPLVSFGQTKESIELCFALQSSSFSSNLEAENALSRILNTIGAKKNFVVSSCSDIDNAVAVSYKGVRYILYDRDFLNRLNNSSNDWFGLTVLAHEVGHHINGHSIDILLALGDVVESKSLEKRRKQELEADEFAGFVLAKLGAPLNQIKNNIASISSEADDLYSTHPSRQKRLNAIQTGYLNGSDQVSIVKNDNIYLEKQNTAEIDIYSIDYDIFPLDEEKSSDLVNSAIEDNDLKKYNSAGKKLELVYSYGGDYDRNIDYLYYAASSYVNGKNYRAALTPYLFLYKRGYRGITKTYYMTGNSRKNKGEVVELSEEEYDLYKSTNLYINPRIEMSESKYPEIVKNIALIYSQLGNNDKAMKFVSYARKENPTDLELILTEANLYIQLDENEKFESLMNQAIAQDPNNPTLYFNLGVINAEKGNISLAKDYYLKTIKLDPTFESGYLNLVALILEGESKIIDETNSLGNSRADNNRYDQLKIMRENLYWECVNHLENLISINGNNIEAINTLMNIYGTLGNVEGFKRMKKKL